MAVNLTAIYLHVVADVINNVRADFLSEGVDETVLHELQSLWELNMMQAGTIQAAAPGDIPFARGGGGGHPPITPVHDLNMPYEGETPTAELLFPPTPVHTPLPTFLPPGPSPSKNEYPEAGIAGDVAIGRPTLFMPSPWMNQNPDTSLGMNPKLDMNVAYEGGDEEEAPSGQVPVTKEFLPPSTGKRKREDIAPNYLSGSFFPQHDGAGDILTSPVSLEQASYSVEAKKPLLMEDSTALAAKRNLRVGIDQCKHTEERTLADALMHATVDARRTATHSSIPQFDGIGDNYDDDVAEEDYNEPGEEEQPAADDGDLKPLKLEGAESDGSEPPLNEDDDLDDLDDIDKGDEESKTEHLVLAQFEKVTRSKNKWKCALKDGIMHLNHRDFLFSRANGEFEF